MRARRAAFAMQHSGSPDATRSRQSAKCRYPRYLNFRNFFNLESIVGTETAVNLGENFLSCIFHVRECSEMRYRREKEFPMNYKFYNLVMKTMPSYSRSKTEEIFPLVKLSTMRSFEDTSVQNFEPMSVEWRPLRRGRWRHLADLFRSKFRTLVSRKLCVVEKFCKEKS